MDPITGVTTVITFVTFIKDITAIAMAVKDAVDKRGDNLQDAKDACEDILLLLTGLARIGEEQGDQTFTRQLSNARGDWVALEQFKRELLRFHKAYMAVITNVPPSKSLSRWSASYSWLWNIGRQETTARDLSRLRDSVKGLMRRFQALALVRVEQTQLQHSAMLQRAEHTNRLVLADTTGGRQAIADRKELAQALLELPYFLRSTSKTRPASALHSHHHNEPYDLRNLPRSPWKEYKLSVANHYTNTQYRRGDNAELFTLRWTENLRHCGGTDEYTPMAYENALVRARTSAERSLEHLDGEESC